MVQRNETFPIVCMAGSAGAFWAYEQILHHVPADTGMSFIIVAHRGDHATEVLRGLLNRRTRMDVVDANEGIVLRPNRVILSAPHRPITTDGYCIHLADPAPRAGWPVLISGFLQSMAETCASRSIAVILSGMGFDGSNQLGAIKRAGGITFAQSRAECADMPEAAMATGHVDWSLDAGEIGKMLTKMAREGLSSSEKADRKLVRI